jgi:hypothetical protein
MATSTRKRKPKPITLHPAGSPEAIADVKAFGRQEARRRVRREAERELERQLQQPTRKRPRV